MPSYNPLEKLRVLWRRKTTTNGTSRSCSLGTDPPSVATSQESTTSSTYRNASDAAQTFLPPVHAILGVIPGVGGIVKGVIEGILSILQLVDKRIQNKGDLEQLKCRLRLLLRLIEDAPQARSTHEETMRRRLLSQLESAKPQLEILEKRIGGSPSVVQEIAGVITTVNNHLLEYVVFSHMYRRYDMDEIKTCIDKIAQSSFKQMQYIENLMTTGTAGQLPPAISRGHAVLVDATGREHCLLLDQCSHLDQLDLMLRVSLLQCTPQEVEVLRWYIGTKKYDFVIFGTIGSAVTQLTRQSDIWSNLRSGTKIVMRAIIEEEVDFMATETCKCQCGTSNTVDVTVEDPVAALKQGCTITCLKVDTAGDSSKSHVRKEMIM